MQEVQLFNFKENDVHTIMVKGDPYFLGKDCAEAIGYTNSSKAVRDHVKEKYKLTERIVLSGQNREVVFISEPGLYQLASQSKLPNAEVFQDWVYEEVLPSIRKHGAYLTPSKLEEVLLNPDMIIQLATQLKEEQAKNKELEFQKSNLEEEKKVLEPKAEYTDTYLKNPTLLSVSEIAKDYGMSARKFNALLHYLKIQYKQGKIWLLYADYQDKGYTQSYTAVINDDYAATFTKWTPKGKEFLNKFLADNGFPLDSQKEEKDNE